VQRIVKQDLQFQTHKRVIGQVINENCKLKRLQRSQQLLDRFPNQRSVGSIWFTDEKTILLLQHQLILKTIGFILKQERKTSSSNETHSLREREHFSCGIMVSVDVSRIRKTSILLNLERK